MVGADGRYHGLRDRTGPRRGAGDEQSGDHTVADLAELPALVTRASPLPDALGALVSAQGTGLPVLDGDATELVGWITHQSVLKALSLESVGSTA